MQSLRKFSCFQNCIQYKGICLLKANDLALYCNISLNNCLSSLSHSFSLTLNLPSASVHFLSLSTLCLHFSTFKKKTSVGLWFQGKKAESFAI